MSETAKAKPARKRRKPKGKVRIMIDFPSMTDLTNWFEEVRAFGVLPHDSAVYAQDALDTTKRSGVTPAKTFIVRRQGDRPYDPEIPGLDYDPQADPPDG